MIALDEQALICDLAEVYHIFDYRSLPVRLVATLSSGLGDNSRIKRKARNEEVDTDTFLRAVIADRLAQIQYMLSSGKAEPPELITEMLLGKKQREPELKTFSTPEEFMKAWKEKTEGGD